METEQKNARIKQWDRVDIAAKVGAGVLFIAIRFLLGGVMVFCFLPSIILFTGSVPVWDSAIMYGISLSVGMVLFGSIIAVCKKVVE